MTSPRCASQQPADGDSNSSADGANHDDATSMAFLFAAGRDCPPPEIDHESEITPRRLVYWTAIMEGSMLAVAGIGNWVLRPGHSLWGENRSAVAWIVGFCAGCVLYVIARGVASLPWPALVRFRDFMQKQIVPLFERCTPGQLLLVSVLAGVGEEAFFRGLVQEGITSWTASAWGPWPAVVGGALLFGACHATGRVYFVLATLAGIYFGVTVYLTDSVIAGAVAHTTYDWLMLWYLTRTAGSTGMLPRSSA